jgi:hypothetical protein
MTRQRFFLAALAILIGCNFAKAQAPGVLYTWPGVGNVAGWQDGGGDQFADVQNTVAGQLTVNEGDPLNPGSHIGQEVKFHNSRPLEAFPREGGGLDLTGLSFIEMDINHNSPTATVNVQAFAQLTPTYTYVSGDSDGTLGRNPTFGPDWSIGPGVHTIKIPVNQMTLPEQAYIIAFGLDVRAHTDVGNLTWTVSEIRAVGTPLTTRVIANHTAGSSDNGLNGAYINFEGAATDVLGGTGQGQAGLSENPAGTGSLEWTDLGGGNGAAISWGNGTSFAGNNYFERPTNAGNYNRIVYRVKATDASNPTGTVGIQSYFQNDNYLDYQVAGSQNLPTDGQYHDLTFTLTGLHSMASIDAFGINLGAHTTNLLMDVDSVQFTTVNGVPGDYNDNGVVDMADYVLWRKGGPLQNEVNTPGTVDASDYDAWRAKFGNTSGSGSLNGAAVPEPTAMVLVVIGIASCCCGSRRKGKTGGPGPVTA